MPSALERPAGGYAGVGDAPGGLLSGTDEPLSGSEQSGHAKARVMSACIPVLSTYGGSGSMPGRCTAPG